MLAGGALERSLSKIAFDVAVYCMVYCKTLFLSERLRGEFVDFEKVTRARCGYIASPGIPREDTGRLLKPT
jgi:hypothetical protein